MVLDRNTIRNLIVSLRDNDGMTFENISTVMEDRYGYKASRQAINSIYNRAKASLKRCGQVNKQQYSLGVNVANIIARGYKLSDIECAPEKFGITVGVDRKKLTDALNLVGGLTHEIYDSIVIGIKQGILVGEDRDRLVATASYGDVAPTDKWFIKMMGDANVEIMQSMLVEYLKRRYNETGDKELIEQILKQFRLNVSVHKICGADSKKECKV